MSSRVMNGFHCSSMEQLHTYRDLIELRLCSSPTIFHATIHDKWTAYLNLHSMARKVIPGISWIMKQLSLNMRILWFPNRHRSLSLFWRTSLDARHWNVTYLHKIYNSICTVILCGISHTFRMFFFVASHTYSVREGILSMAHCIILWIWYGLLKLSNLSTPVCLPYKRSTFYMVNYLYVNIILIFSWNSPWCFVFWLTFPVIEFNSFYLSLIPACFS